MAILCLNEETPVILALCLFGTVFFIVGGGMWGRGTNTDDTNSINGGIAMLSVGVFLISLGATGMACNAWFCTPKRKSKIARIIFKDAKLPEDYMDAYFEDESESGWGSRLGSFRSLRSSRRSLRSSRKNSIQPVTSPTQVNMSKLSESSIPEREVDVIKVTSVSRVDLNANKDKSRCDSPGSIRTHDYISHNNDNHLPLDVADSPPVVDDRPPAHFANETPSCSIDRSQDSLELKCDSTNSVSYKYLTQPAVVHL